MASDVCVKRLQKEYRELTKKPVEGIRAAPRDSNILEFHYVLEGAKDSPYEGGYYHGMLSFPQEYPYKPPSIQMFTPNGRFKTCTRLCLSMSDYHPETWNPMWSVGTILMGLFSFMSDTQSTVGSMESSHEYKRKAAMESLAYNCKNKEFCELFPELKELHEKQKQEKLNQLSNPALSTNASNASVSTIESENVVGVGSRAKPQDSMSLMTFATIVFAIFGCIYIILKVAS